MMPTLRHLLGTLLLALALAVPASAVAAPTPAPAEFYGANIQALIRQGFVKPAAWPSFLGAGRSAGMTIARFDAPWAWVEPKAPGADGQHRYDWSRLDQIARMLAGLGMRCRPVVDFPPAWASGDGSSLSEERQADFAAFAAAFAARYGPGGAYWLAHPDVAELPVQQVEMWTEANSTHFWAGNLDPASYLAAFVQVRNAVKAVSPTMQVLVSLGWQDFEGYTEALYQAGLQGNSDGIAFHPYAPTARGVVVLTRKLREKLAAHGEPDLPIFMTEIGWPRAPAGSAGAARSYEGPVADNARAATASLAADALSISDCDVKDFIFYSLVEEQKDPSNLEDWLGLYNPDGTPTATAQALEGAAGRWGAATLRAHASGPPKLLPLCHGPTSEQAVASSPMPPNGQLPIQLSVPMPASTPCLAMQARYYGNPLEDVSVFVRTYRGKQAAVVTKAAGVAPLCMAAASRKKPFLVWARSGGLASSPVQSCKGVRCYPVSCRRASVKLKPKRLSAYRMQLRLSVKCGRRLLFGERVKINGINRKGKPRKLKQLITGTTTQTIKLAWKPKWNLRTIKVRFGGDKTFALIPRVRTVRLGKKPPTSAAKRAGAPAGGTPAAGAAAPPA